MGPFAGCRAEAARTLTLLKPGILDATCKKPTPFMSGRQMSNRMRAGRSSAAASSASFAVPTWRVRKPQSFSIREATCAAS